MARNRVVGINMCGLCAKNRQVLAAGENCLLTGCPLMGDPASVLK